MSLASSEIGQQIAQFECLPSGVRCSRTACRLSTWRKEIKIKILSNFPQILLKVFDDHFKDYLTLGEIDSFLRQPSAQMRRDNILLFQVRKILFPLSFPGLQIRQFFFPQTQKDCFTLLLPLQLCMAMYNVGPGQRRGSLQLDPGPQGLCPV